MTFRRHNLIRALRSHDGQTLTEYGLLIALIAVLVAASLPPVAGALGAMIDAAAGAFGG